MADQGAVDEKALRALGARGFVRPSDKHLQVVIGPVADEVAREMRRRGCSGARPTKAPASRLPTAAEDPALAAAIATAVGGKANIRDAAAGANRLLLALDDIGLIDEATLRRLGARALAKTSGGRVQILMDTDAGALAAAVGGLA